MTHDVRRRLKVNGVLYLPGETITSEQIGNPRLERQFKSLGRVRPQKEQPPEAPAIPMEQVLSVSPPRNKGGRPRKL